MGGFELYEYVAEYGQYDQEREVKCAEFENIRQRVLGVLLCVFFKGNKAGERCDQSARTTDIYTEQQLTIVVGELGEQYSRWNVGDYLTAHSREHQRIDVKQVGKEVAHNTDSSHISRKDEEKHKSKQQTVVHLTKRLSVKEE